MATGAGSVVVGNRFPFPTAPAPDVPPQTLSLTPTNATLPGAGIPSMGSVPYVGAISLQDFRPGPPMPSVTLVRDIMALQAVKASPPWPRLHTQATWASPVLTPTSTPKSLPQLEVPALLATCATMADVGAVYAAAVASNATIYNHTQVTQAFSAGLQAAVLAPSNTTQAMPLVPLLQGQACPVVQQSIVAAALNRNFGTQPVHATDVADFAGGFLAGSARTAVAGKHSVVPLLRSVLAGQTPVLDIYDRPQVCPAYRRVASASAQDLALAVLVGNPAHGGGTSVTPEWVNSSCAAVDALLSPIDPTQGQLVTHALRRWERCPLSLPDRTRAALVASSLQTVAVDSARKGEGAPWVQGMWVVTCSANDSAILQAVDMCLSPQVVRSDADVLGTLGTALSTTARSALTATTDVVLATAGTVNAVSRAAWADLHKAASHRIWGEMLTLAGQVSKLYGQDLLQDMTARFERLQRQWGLHEDASSQLALPTRPPPALPAPSPTPPVSVLGSLLPAAPSSVPPLTAMVMGPPAPFPSPLPGPTYFLTPTALATPSPLPPMPLPESFALAVPFHRPSTWKTLANKIYGTTGDVTQALTALESLSGAPDRLKLSPDILRHAVHVAGFANARVGVWDDGATEALQALVVTLDDTIAHDKRRHQYAVLGPLAMEAKAALTLGASPWRPSPMPWPPAVPVSVLAIVRSKSHHLTSRQFQDLVTYGDASALAAQRDGVGTLLVAADAFGQGSDPWSHVLSSSMRRAANMGLARRCGTELAPAAHVDADVNKVVTQAGKIDHHHPTDAEWVRSAEVAVLRWVQFYLDPFAARPEYQLMKWFFPVVVLNEPPREHNLGIQSEAAAQYRQTWRHLFSRVQDYDRFWEALQRPSQTWVRPRPHFTRNTNLASDPAVNRLLCAAVHFYGPAQWPEDEGWALRGVPELNAALRRQMAAFCDECDQFKKCTRFAPPPETWPLPPILYDSGDARSALFAKAYSDTEGAPGTLALDTFSAWDGVEALLSHRQKLLLPRPDLVPLRPRLAMQNWARIVLQESTPSPPRGRFPWPSPVRPVTLVDALYLVEWNAMRMPAGDLVPMASFLYYDLYDTLFTFNYTYVVDALKSLVFHPDFLQPYTDLSFASLPPPQDFRAFELGFSNFLRRSNSGPDAEAVFLACPPHVQDVFQVAVPERWGSLPACLASYREEVEKWMVDLLDAAAQQADKGQVDAPSSWAVWISSASPQLRKVLTRADVPRMVFPKQCTSLLQLLYVEWVQAVHRQPATLTVHRFTTGEPPRLVPLTHTQQGGNWSVAATVADVPLSVAALFVKDAVDRLQAKRLGAPWANLPLVVTTAALTTQAQLLLRNMAPEGFHSL